MGGRSLLSTPRCVPRRPLYAVPAPIACALFMWIGAGCFAWALMKHGYGPLLAFGAAGFLNTSEVVQWSPLFAAATVLTPLSVAWIIKPQIGAAMFLVRPNWWAVWGAIVLTALAFLVQPGWIADWRDGLAEAHLSTGKGWQYLSRSACPVGSSRCSAFSAGVGQRQARVRTRLAPKRCSPMTPCRSFSCRERGRRRPS